MSFPTSYFIVTKVASKNLRFYIADVNLAHVCYISGRIKNSLQKLNYVHVFKIVEVKLFTRTSVDLLKASMFSVS